MMKPKDMIKVLTGQCEHKREERGRTEEGKLVCLTCGVDVPEPTREFRKYIRMNKHLRLRVGIPMGKDGKPVYQNPDPTYNVGIRFIVPGHPEAVKRVWVTFVDKGDAKTFMAELNRRLRFCGDDEAYNAVINEAVDMVLAANPEIKERVIDRGESDSEADEA